MDEEARLEALRKYRILDTAPEPQFDRVAEIARRQFDVPVALVAFMDSDRNFLKAHGDLPFDESPRAISFCGHTILDDRVLVVGDATKDMRFAENPLVVGDMALRFYAGAPLITPSGHRIGTVCLFDVNPHDDFDEARKRQLSDLASIVVDHLEMRYIVGNVHDEIETRRAAEAEAWSAARTDALTGLPNRTALNDLIEGRLPFAVTGQLAVFYADIDGFKAVNAAFGHQVGDEILQTVAAKVTDCMGEDAFVARASGDEFIVVFDVDSALVAEAKAAELIAQVTDTRSVNRVAVSIGLTVGIALGVVGEAKTAALIREADIALYEAKRAGRNRARVFDDSMAAAAVRRRLIEHDLPEAMASGAIAVHFQPVVRASTREMIGVEALARWRHPLLGDIAPLEFVGIAEETGQVRALGRHILRTALSASRNWSSLFVAVNLSPLEFRLPDLAEDILGTLEEIDFPPARLEVEVTESLLLDDIEATRQQIVTLHDHGIKVALDDFGTGYSSLSYLRTIPFDKVKIDRSFVTDIGTDDTSAAIVECVANLARQLNIDVTAEGVETEDQEILLRAAGCGTFQGYRFGRPMPAADLDTRYRRQAEPAASIRLVAG